MHDVVSVDRTLLQDILNSMRDASSAMGAVRARLEHLEGQSNALFDKASEAVEQIHAVKLALAQINAGALLHRQELLEDRVRSLEQSRAILVGAIAATNVGWMIGMAIVRLIW